ncbi:DUF374 domain-containing protein [Fibrobacterales bacterium]|nr:DUF374 domain-containing protein [Fibrobacterales bacterium]
MKITLINLILKIWFKTIKIELPKEALPTPTVFGVWHQDLFAAAVGFRHLDLCCLISKSNDGDILSKVLDTPNMTIVRGSSSRGMLSVRSLIKVVRSEPYKSIIHALDGPRGPALQAKPGFEWLKKQTGHSLVILEFQYSSCKRLSSWDKMIVPLPFSTIKVSKTHSLFPL